MSYGIPSLYVASEDSELHDYAEKYGHARCVSHNNLDEAVKYILALKSDPDLQEKYSHQALAASQNYRRSNADRIVAYYLETSGVGQNAGNQIKTHSHASEQY